MIARDYALPPWTTPGGDRAVRRATPARPRRRSPPTTPPARSARGASSARPAARWPQNARADGVPVIPLPGGFQPRAAVGYSLVVALEVAALAGVGESLHSEIDVAAAHAEQLVAQWGPDAPEDSPAKTLARALHGTVPQIAGAGLTAPDRLPLEDADQRERQVAVLRRRAARARPQRDRRLGGGRGAGALQRGVPRRLRPASPRAGADRAHARAGRRARGRRPRRSRRRREPRGARWSRWCCSATSCRSTWPRCAAWIRRTVVPIDRLKAALGSATG